MLLAIACLILNCYLYFVSVTPVHHNVKEKGDEVVVENQTLVNAGPTISRYLLFATSVFYLICLYRSDGSHNLSTTSLYLLFVANLAGLFRIYAMQVLGHFFTFELAIRKDHKLIQTGPYSVLIHPSYTGALLNHILETAFFFNAFYELGMISFTPALLGFLGLGVLFPLFPIWKRMQNEEKMLKEAFGSEFDQYLETRWRLIPFVY